MSAPAPTRCEPIVVEQLNRAQWHATVADGGGLGVGNYVQILADALVWAALDRRGLVTVALDGTRRRLVRTPRQVFQGGVR